MVHFLKHWEPVGSVDEILIQSVRPLQHSRKHSQLTVVLVMIMCLQTAHSLIAEGVEYEEVKERGNLSISLFLQGSSGSKFQDNLMKGTEVLKAIMAILIDVTFVCPVNPWGS